MKTYYSKIFDRYKITIPGFLIAIENRPKLVKTDFVMFDESISTKVRYYRPTKIRFDDQLEAWCFANRLLSLSQRAIWRFHHLTKSKKILDKSAHILDFKWR